MPRHKQDPYQCPRCGYKSDKRSCFVFHFYKLKKPCPGTKSNIDLTDDIKQHILNNRIYHIPKTVDPAKVIKQTITYNNTMNNFISNMDTIDKLQKVLKYHNKPPVGFAKHVENTLQCCVEELGNDTHCNVALSSNDILDLVDKVSLISNANLEQPLQAFNILYDTKLKTLKTCNDNGSWNEHLLHKGVQMVMQVIQEAYLEEYEKELIRRIHTASQKRHYREKQHAEEILESYYKFLACFELEPIVSRMRDRDILYRKFTREWEASHSRDYADRYFQSFNKIKDSLLQKEIIAIHKKAIDILRHNSRRNIDELNRMVVSLFVKDEDFKACITGNMEVPTKCEREPSFYQELYEDLNDDEE